MKIKIDHNKLRQFCNAKISYFEKFGDVKQTKNGTTVYIDRGSKVLGVAHRDTVHTKHEKFKAVKNYVMTPRLDDRLGVYLLVDYFLNVEHLKFDVLLTEGEETGRSTAATFDAPKDYNWIFSFDRRGTDVVMYQYETDKLCTLLEKFGFIVGIGSFSDIGVLDHLGVSGFNFGTGYQNEHTDKCFVDLYDTQHMAGKFVNFFNQNKNTKLPYEPVKSNYWFSGYAGNRKGGYSTWTVWHSGRKHTQTYLNEILTWCKICSHYVKEYEYSYKEAMCFDCMKWVFGHVKQDTSTLLYCDHCDDWVADDEFSLVMNMCLLCVELKYGGL
jgi:hypothetical protein